MADLARKTILHYKILEKLGEGGMGIVYKALDTKLNREVAIKFLLHHITPTEEERERFKIEAQAAAVLNHPNIATIHATEEVDGETFIVMEYIKGLELKDIITSNFPQVTNLREVLDYATQIAEGLQAAHEEGVIHRDIKSANIMITEKDQVKIMDFGLAKLIGGAELTKKHSTLGTAAYMSPEQARGEKIDHRTDIWSFGVMLYEMLSGQLPFKGENDSAVLYSIMNDEPVPIKITRKDVPIELEQAIHNCLEKKRDDRYPSIVQLLADLKQIKKAFDSDGRVEVNVQPTNKVKISKRVASFVFTAAALGLIFILVTIGLNIFKTRTPEPRIVQTSQLTTSTTIYEMSPALSPDGSRIAYFSDETGNLDIWVQQLASGDKINLTKDYQGKDVLPVWSPDGYSIAFVSDRDGGGIFIMSEYGGLVRQIVAQSVKEKEIHGGFSWSPDGKRLAYMIGPVIEGRMYSVAISGGTPTEIPLPEPGFHGPTWSHDGKRLVYTSVKQIWTLSLDGSNPIPVFDDLAPQLPIWSSDGKRIFFKRKTSGENPDIWWIPVDRIGKPVSTAKQLTVGAMAYTFSLAGDGSRIAYSGGSGYRNNIWCLPIDTRRTLSMADAKQITFEEQNIGGLVLSPDGEWFAFNSNRGERWNNIWIIDKNGKGLRRVTADSTNAGNASWSPDGKRLTIVRRDFPGSQADIYMISINSSLSTALAPHPADDNAPSWSPEGKEIVFSSNRGGNYDLWMVPVSGGEPRQLMNHQANEGRPKWSPDGKLIGFLSDRSGAYELYIMQYNTNNVRKLTHLGSTNWFDYTWSLDGKVIYLNYATGSDSDTRILAAINVSSGAMHRILEAKVPLTGIGWSVATDGEMLYFVGKKNIPGDIWIADLVYE